MIVGDIPGDLWIVGPGRMGLALGRSLVHAGWGGDLTFLGRRPEDQPPRGREMPGVRYAPLHQARDLVPPRILCITVPDAAVAEVSETIATIGFPPGVALHTSGALPSAALTSLSSRGWETASMHPLVAIPDPDSGAQKLRGAWFGIEGSAEAVRVARSIVGLLEGHELLLETDKKPLYHAAAVMASNHVVSLLDVAVRMMTRCGVDPGDSAAALGRLAGGAVEDVLVRGPLMALTGPVVRGDVATVRAHLHQLSGDESRLYSVLAREALRIAVARGLSPSAAAEIEAILLEELD